MLRVILFLILGCFSVSGDVNGYNFTYSMAAHCKEHICREGYRYVTFYSVDHGAYKNKNSTERSTTLEMHIAILAPRDGHILLSSVSDPQPTDPVYELVIGGGSNTFSELRRMRQKYAKSTRRTSNILSAIEYRAFWIKIFVDGVIEFGEEGKNTSLLSYLDPDPITVNYFSFAAWSGVEAKFLYDCPLAGDVIETSNSTIVPEPPLPLSLQLRRSILLKGGSLIAPVDANNSRVLVTLMTKVLTIDFDVKTSIINVVMAFIMIWRDRNLRWNTLKYDGIKGIIFENGEIWTPQLAVINGVGIDVLQPRSKSPLIVTNDGNVVQTFSTTFKAVCDPGDGITRWPRDQHECTINIGPQGARHLFILAVADLDLLMKDSNDSLVGTNGPENGWDIINDASEWEVLKLSQHTEWYDDSPYHKLDVKSKSMDPDDIPDTRLRITLTIKRRDFSTSILVYTPVFALMFISLVMFLVPYEDSRFKQWGYLAQMPIVYSLLCAIQQQIPFISESMPDVAFFYVCMGYTSLSYWIWYVLRDHSLCRRAINSRIAADLFSSPLLRTALCLPVSEDGDDYKSLQECSSSDPEELTSSPTTGDDHNKNRYSDFVIATDRLIFFVYLIFYVSLMFYHL